MAKKKDQSTRDDTYASERDEYADSSAKKVAEASLEDAPEVDNPAGESSAASANRITEAIAAELAPSRRQRLSESQFQTPIVRADPDDPSVKATSRRAILSRMGVAPGKVPSVEKFQELGTKAYPSWTLDNSRNGLIRDVRFTPEAIQRGLETENVSGLEAFRELPKGVEGPVLPITTETAGGLRAQYVSPNFIKPENVEVFDPSEIVITGGVDNPTKTRAPVEDVITQQAAKRAAEQGLAFDPHPRSSTTSSFVDSGKSKYNMTDEQLKAEGLTRSVRNVIPTGKIGNEKYPGPGIDPTTGGVELGTGGQRRRSYNVPLPSSATRVSEQLASLQGVEPPKVSMDYSRRVKINGQEVGVSRSPLPESHPLRQAWEAQQARGAEPEGITVGEFAESRGNPTDPGYGSNIRTSIPLGGATGRGGQAAIRARQERAVPSVVDIPEKVREELERGEMFSEDVTSRALDIWSGVGLEPRNPETLRRPGTSYVSTGDEVAGTPGGIAIPKDMRVGTGPVTTEVPAGTELPEEPTQSERLAAMSGLDIIQQAEEAGRSLETAPEGQTPPAQRPEVRGKISDIRRIQHQARVTGTPLNSDHLAALTALRQATNVNIQSLMRPDLIGKSVTGQIGVDAPVGATPVRKIIKGGDEAARQAAGVEAAEEMGPLEERQAEGSFLAQPGEQGRAARAQQNTEVFIADAQKAEQRAANRRLGLSGPGGGASNVTVRDPEERRARD